MSEKKEQKLTSVFGHPVHDDNNSQTAGYDPHAISILIPSNLFFDPSPLTIPSSLNYQF